MMKILNTLNGLKEEFEPRNGKNVGMFVCGPTVYDYSHVGHARTYIIFDVIAKYLRYKGYKVKFVMNITDIDDKIIQRANEGGKTWKEIAELYERAFMEDIKNLGIDSVDKFAKATEHIKEIIKQAETLIEKGYAYKTKYGVYFDISKFEDYGKLAKRTLEQAEDAIPRIDEAADKRNKGDFALWRFSESEEPSWESLWGLGRPGWHIEDTAISEKYLGQQYEIHCGSQDLIFPHHEAEIAQQEAASGKKPFVKYWLHSGFVIINGQKMSKSLKNFITIRDLLKEYTPEAIRFMTLSAYYRSPIDYKDDLIKQSEAGIQRIRELINKLELIKKSDLKEKNVEIDEIIKKTKIEFEAKMDDDFNTPEAMAILFNFIRAMNGFIDNQKLDRKSAEKTLNFFKKINEVLGIIPENEFEIPEEVFNLAENREKLRKEKAWLEADKVRDQIQSLGYSIEDTPYGPLVHTLSPTNSKQ
ncbi:MAG: cysteine--tRNA ligase [Parcubacteria group bacterium RIFCSPLOWO2_01_FULL_40_65]|nr:MAG: cysteine--tRNA ligase [Parcubacteria group bacterium RIFCSPHIGHO2_01_FULL_40_30]OHB19718.1 MAG: cysteine--tRNA ligase [Parcubacteria group bacterium RIFCSPHIGHO2_02_FULL_40_12]OHB21855.1 MAG: cysteine--tRNA ligase [Parcubacteria group bacterium RIFCSPLOWO2_01_FULL_40_65]OHB23617.1 MAG: cysteine--tRNA ligase [Parcubacteria group bacterium RIFCSPLOWO2_02_FULL_40_12]OHB23759.1 MAG: cysteine--tRNA ligase [Parcubacteria group bacterium RIFCSPLOWO2_12_FULL_40_10]